MSYGGSAKNNQQLAFCPAGYMEQFEATLKAKPNRPRHAATWNAGLGICLSVPRWLLDVIDNVNVHDAFLRFQFQT